MNKTKSDYVAIKFKYRALQFWFNYQNGGYVANDAANLAAAATAVINCTNYGTNTESVDCAYTDAKKKKASFEEQLKNLNNQLTAHDCKYQAISGEACSNESVSKLVAELKLVNVIKRNEKRANIEKEIQTIHNELRLVNKTLENYSASDISNRTCDNNLATVASIYLSIIHHTFGGLAQLMSDLISAKMTNCKKYLNPTEDQTNKLTEVVNYYMRALDKANQYLESIGSTDAEKAFGSYQNIFTNAEFAKQDTKRFNKLKELYPELFGSISEEQMPNFRMVNEFMGSNLQNIKPINLSDIIDNVRIKSSKVSPPKQLSELLESDNLNKIKNSFPNPTFVVRTDDFIVFGIYDGSNNLSNTILYTNIKHLPNVFSLELTEKAKKSSQASNSPVSDSNLKSTPRAEPILSPSLSPRSPSPAGAPIPRSPAPAGAPAQVNLESIDTESFIDGLMYQINY